MKRVQEVQYTPLSPGEKYPDFKKKKKITEFCELG